MSNYLKNIKKYSALQDYSLSNNNIDDEYEEIFNKLDSKKLALIINNYPDFKYEKLTKIIQNKYKINNVVWGSGSEDLIIRINSLLKDLGKIGIVVPNFYRTIETANDYLKIKSSIVADSLYSNIDTSLINNKLKALWISNPNPITGKLYRREQLIDSIKKHHKILFIIDESAIDFIDNVEDNSLIKVAQKENNLIVLRSFSKLYGLAGMRAGFMTGKAKIIKKIKAAGLTFPINGLAEYLITTTIKNNKIINKIKKKIKTNKLIIENLLSKNKNIIINKSSTNCIFIKHRKNNIYKNLINSKIIALNLDTQDGMTEKGFIRITIHSSDKLFNNLYNHLKNYEN